VCNLENIKDEKVMTRVGSQRHSKKHVRDVDVSRFLVFFPQVIFERLLFKISPQKDWFFLA
jgi:hypothetical protein